MSTSMPSGASYAARRALSGVHAAIGEEGVPALPARRRAMNLRVVRDAVSRVLAARADDARLFFLDGRELLPDAEMADLDDGLHPNAAAYERMGVRFAVHAFAAGAPLVRPRV